MTGTHRELWGGVDGKLEAAWFHLQGMQNAILPPEQSAAHIAMGLEPTKVWHRPFYAHLDAFLSASRSIPEILRCLFGRDDRPRVMKEWFDALATDEQQRRMDFSGRFKPDYDRFRALPLGNARHISEHRTGVAPVTVTVTGRFGVTYIGSPTEPIPATEIRELPPEYGWMARPVAVQPRWTDFEIDGKPLFETCRDYLNEAQALIQRTLTLAEEVHGSQSLTPPPSNM